MLRHGGALTIETGPGAIAGCAPGEGIEALVEDLEDAIDSLGTSVGTREKEQEAARARGQNTSSDSKERQKYRAHQDQLTEEKKLKEDLERKQKQGEDKRAREEQAGNRWSGNRNPIDR